MSAPHRTIEEWLRMMPNEEIINAALENLERHCGDKHRAKVKRELVSHSFANALSSAFTWDSSPQGDAFWRFIYNNSQIK